MKKTETQINAEIRAKYLNQIKSFFEKCDEDVRVTGSNEVAFPIVDENDNEKWLKVVVTVPKGSRDGTEYDGYEEEKAYQFKLEQKEIKRKKKEQKKKGK